MTLQPYGWLEATVTGLPPRSFIDEGIDRNGCFFGGSPDAFSPDGREFIFHTDNCLMETCIFCQIIEGVAPAHRVWESAHFVAFLTIRPCNPGHTLLIPKGHVDYVFDLEEPLYSGMFQAAKHLAGPIKQATAAERVGVAIEGFSVPHAHLHLVPLYTVSELDPNRHVDQTQEELAEMAEKIRKVMAGGGTQSV